MRCLRVALFASGVIVCAFASALAAAAPPALVRVGPVAFPPPATAPVQPRVRFEVVSSRAVGVDLAMRPDARPPWAAPRAYGLTLIHAIVDPPTAFLLYGPEDGFGATTLVAASPRSHATRYAFDLRFLAVPPTRTLLQPIMWAVERDRVLYVSTSNLNYARENRNRNAYVTAISVPDGKVLWRSSALVANARSFAVVGDLLVTGYGFTAEPDFVYALDRRTGKVVGRVSVPTAPERIRVEDDRVIVRTYDHRVVLRLVRG